MFLYSFLYIIIRYSDYFVKRNERNFPEKSSGNSRDRLGAMDDIRGRGTRRAFIYFTLQGFQERSCSFYGSIGETMERTALFPDRIRIYHLLHEIEGFGEDFIFFACI